MDLSKAFDCIPHDLLIARLHAYGFSEKTVTFSYSYLKRRKQNVKIENFYSNFHHNTISTASKNMSNLIQTLEKNKESERAVDWFNQNKMIVNSEKF